MALPDLKHTDAGEFSLSYREQGPKNGDAPALFFVHGMGGGSSNWETQYEQFSDRYRVIGWDAPGYGDSSSFDTDLPSVGDYIMAMADFLNSLGVVKAHLVGHSYGGIMVTAFNRAYSDRVLSLTLAQAVIGGGGEKNVKKREAGINDRIEELKNLGIDGFARLHAPRSCSPHALPDVVMRGIEVTAAMNKTGYIRQFRSLRHANIFEWTARPRVPAMIVSGEHDKTAGKNMIREITDAMPGIRHHEISGIGHMIYLEHPDRFNALLEDLLAETA
ncbi:alpha/beta hydrolase [Alphaproteobacteria bacterium]|nr:alpha/beta hydrolase [Alphaproteobacteria bacterium]